MCGICGIFDFSQKKVNKEELVKMCRTLEHRGPDDEGFYISKNIGLANRRLSIIDLGKGHQPICNENEKIWITFNGEIYNFIKLREDLIKKGHHFYTKTDTEVIVHLYEELKEKCVNKLEGMFAFGIIDQKNKKLFLARDPLGEKPLFWTVFDNKFIFSSEIKGILAYPGFRKEINDEALREYLLYGFIPSPKTIFRGIRQIPPGYFLSVNETGEVKEEKYWEIDYSKKNSGGEERIIDEAKIILERSVEKMLVADVPLGVFLSGGVDSSLVTALMAKILGPKKVWGFTIAFREESVDESAYARIVAKYLGIKHNLKIFSQQDLLVLLPRVAETLDSPIADPSILPTFLLSGFVKNYVKVALSGDGGDENFAGYPKYLAHYFLTKTSVNKLPNLHTTASRLGKMGKFLDYISYPLHLRNQLWISHFSPEEIEKLTGKKVNFSEIEDRHKIFNGEERLDEPFFLDQKLTLPDLYLVKVDRASMANSLEVRCPFLDKNLVEFCAKIPFGIKLKGFKTKSLLKKIALQYLPAEAILRPKKGFGIPLRKWLKKDMQPALRDVFSSSEAKNRGILSQKEVEDFLLKGTPSQIWSLLVLELWCQRWLKN